MDSVGRGLAVVGRLWRRSRRFVVLKNSGNLAKKSLLFVRIFTRILSVGGSQRRWQRLTSSAEDSIEESRYCARLVAGFAGLGARHKRRYVIVGTGWRGQAIRRFIELHIHHARRLDEGLHVGILRQQGSFFHELGPDGSGGLRAGEANIAVVVVADPDDAQ